MGVSFKMTQLVRNGWFYLQKRSPLAQSHLSLSACTACPLRKGELGGEGSLQSISLASGGEEIPTDFALRREEGPRTRKASTGYGHIDALGLCAGLTSDGEDDARVLVRQWRGPPDCFAH